MESAIAVYFGELCGCGGWYVDSPFVYFHLEGTTSSRDLLTEILFFSCIRSLPHRLRPKRRSEIFWCVFGSDSFDCEWTLYFDVAGE